MAGGFNMDDYVDVAQRISDFAAKYPVGSLQSRVTYHEDPPGWFAEAKAFRTPNDPCPGIGHAFEPVPGKTPYTRDSEAQNAETSAWGRAIVALGFSTKKIASANEVRAREPAMPELDHQLEMDVGELIGLSSRLGVEEVARATIDMHRREPDFRNWVTAQLKAARVAAAKLEQPES